MLSCQSFQSHQQTPLIEIINEDDELLLNSPDAQWYEVLKFFPSHDYADIAALYYDALYDFNMNQREKHNAKVRTPYLWEIAMAPAGRQFCLFTSS